MTPDPDPWEDAWWVFAEPPELEVEIAERADPPRLLDANGAPIPRLVHRFGFRARPEWD